MNNQSAGMPAMPASNEQEKKIIVRTFKDNEHLLKTLRALFLGLGLTEEEGKTITSLKPEVKNLLRDRLYPELDKESPMGQVKDIWLGAEQMIFGQPPHVIRQAILYKEKALRMTKGALELLEGKNVKVELEYNPSKDGELGENLLARNQYIRHIEGQLYSLWIIANQTSETPKQKETRLKKDSVQ